MITSTLSKLNIRHTEQSGQIVTDCPSCGKGKHLYIDPDKLVFNCRRCNYSGTWRQLAEALGTGKSPVEIQPLTGKKEYHHPTEEYVSSCHKKLLGQNGTKAIEYLYSRKITLDTIHKFRLGLEIKDKKEWIVMPYFKNEKPVNVKYRSVPPAEKEFRRWKDGESSLFNCDILKTLKKEDTVIIVEGEMDCLSLHSQGITNVVSTSIGANGIKPEWIISLEKFKDVVIVYDSDEAGQKGAKELGKRLDLDRCRNLILPVKDSNEFFEQGRSVEYYRDLLEGATHFPIENIMSMEQVFKSLIESYDKENQSTALKPQWPCVEKIQGPYEPGDLIVLSAPPKIGKSSYALNEAIYHAKNGNPVLFFCLEMRPERIMKKVFQYQGRLSEKALNPEVMTRLYGEVADIPLYSGYVYKKCTLDVVIDTIRLGMKRYGFKLVIFDNLHFLARSLTHQVQEVGLVTRSLKMLAEELQVPIILIAHPRKLGEDRIMGIEDLKDSSSIGADADTVVVLYRKKAAAIAGEDTTEVSYMPETLVRVDASRFHAGGQTVLWFEGETGVFSMMTDRTEHN